MSRGYLDIEKLTNDGWTLFRNIHGPNSIASEIRTLEYFAAPDVVQVVRCKDCRFFQTDECRYDWPVQNANDYCSKGERIEVVRCKDCAIPHNRRTGCPQMNGTIMEPDDYCSYGKRKEGEE